MAKEVQQTVQDPRFLEFATKIRSIEEKQKIIKERLLLVSQNIIEIKEKQDQKIIEIIKQIEVMKNAIAKTTSFLEMASSEFQKFARKEDLEILTKQAKMFQPLK